MALRSILVGLDGTEYCEAAAALAIDWAKRFEATVAAIGIVDSPMIRSPQSEPVGGQQLEEQLESKHVQQAKQEVQHYLEGFRGRCKEQGVKFELIKESGTPYEQILQESERFDLIMLGEETHFHYEQERNPGETLNKVLKTSVRPVVTVPKAGRQGDGILVAYDGGMSSARAVQFMVGSGLQKLGPVHILSADRDSKQKAEGHAQRLADYLSHHEVQARPLAKHSEREVGDIILDEADRLGVGLIIMGAFGSAALLELIFGSVTQKVVEKTDRPLFLMH